MPSTTHAPDNPPRQTGTGTTGVSSLARVSQPVLERPTNNLPIELSSFIGRAREIATVKELLSAARLLTLTGAGGSGKTRLALRAAADLVESYADGVWLVELAPLADPSLVPHAVAAVLDVREQPGQPMLDTLADSLRARHLLLVLDNCEHLVDACARLAHTLLRACPDLSILATSREALGIAGETDWTVPLLALPDAQHPPTLANLADSEAIQLFVARAGEIKTNFTLSESNAAAVAQICQRLDGIPLAIELAAARVKVLQPAEIAGRLDDRFSLLTLGGRTAIPRHQTLCAAIDWSYDLLSEPERVLLRRLSVFAGGWTLVAAEQVCADRETRDGISASQVLELLSHLVDKSLVLVDQQGGETRYHLLETIREYAHEKLIDSSESVNVHTSHFHFFLKLAEQAEPNLRNRDRRTWLERLDAELDNLRMALQWSQNSAVESGQGLRLAGALLEFWHSQGYLQEGRAWLETSLTRADSAGTTSPRDKMSHKAKALYGLGRLVRDLGDHLVAKVVLESSLRLWREAIPPDREGLARTLVELGILLQKEGQPLTAQALIEEAVELFRAQSDQVGLAGALCALAMAIRDQRDYARARRVAEEGAAIYRALGDEWALADALHILGLIAYREGDYAAGISNFEEALVISHKLGERVQIAFRMHNLGNLFLCQGDQARAKELNQQGEVLFREVGNKDGIAQSLYRHGHIAMFQDDILAAEAYYREVLEMVREGYGTGWLLGGSLFGMAMVSAVRGRLERAALLWGAAEKQIAVASSYWDAAERRLYEHIIAPVQGRLGRPAFETAYLKGQAMTPEQAISLALETLEPPRGEVARLPISGLATTQTFSGLTPRERQVAAHIAQGESNQEIAQALVVSERTVESHVTNILNKLGFTTRAQIRKWAQDKGLSSQNI